jgi:diguanylate cyclase (GGDEF)-like protein
VRKIFPSDETENAVDPVEGDRPGKRGSHAHIRLARQRTNKWVVLPVVGVMAVMSITVALLLSWSAGRTDRITLDQQQEMVASFADKMALDMAGGWEGNTMWDQAVLETHKPVVDPTWMDSFYGTFHTAKVSGSESYVLDSNDRPYYAARGPRRVDPQRFAERKALFGPMVAELRRKMLNPEANLQYGWKSPGIADFRTVAGFPAIVILKPVISHTGKIYQKPGTEHVWVYVYRLDDENLRKWGKQYFLHGVRFSWTGEHSRSEALRPMISAKTGRTAGYFVWQPFAPGTIVFSDMIPPLLAALALVGFVVSFLIRHIKRSTVELMASEAQAKHLAFHDVLTGLPNRALFEDRLDRALAAARRHPDEKVALLCLDLDRFKQVNDTLGHPAGDELIRELGRRLTAIVRQNDTVARLGGDEFAIIQTDVHSQRDIESLCERILAAASEPFDVVGSQVFVGMSIGVARSGEDGFDRTELARKADIALYRAKSEGRGRYVVFAGTMDAGVLARQAIERDLRAALEKAGELEVYYQPQYDAGSKAVSGVEALLRWHHPEQGLICPSIFIPIAEETGLIEPLGEWVLEEACIAGAHWPVGTVSVNISAVQLRNPFFANKVLEILDGTGMEPHRLELEITETAFLDNVEQCEANLKLLRFARVRIALDDFGTGYSSFNNLRNYEVDRLKIDPSFTNAIESSADGSAIIRAIINLAQSTGLKVTAEGVETIEQSDFLSAAGCDELQGFLMSRAVPIGRIDTMLGIDPAVRRGADAACNAPRAAAQAQGRRL